MATKQSLTGRSDNRDPITDEPGAHPVGAGIGAAVGGAAAGAAAGTLAGPVGTVVGTIAGGVAGGLAGKEIAEQIDPAVEDHHWRNEYPMRHYYDPKVGYDQVGPAYQYGWESRVEYGDRHFEEVEPDLAKDWPNRRGTSKLNWHHARAATRDAWDRVHRNVQSTSDNDIGNSEFIEERGMPVPRVPK